METTLRKALARSQRLRNQVEDVLLGNDGDVWEAELKKFLAKRPCWQKPSKRAKATYELYLFGKQKEGGWETGFAIDKHLKDTKLYERTLSLDDDLVKGWIANPETYPEEFKGKGVFLWKSQRTTGSDRFVAYLYWLDDRVVVHWDWLECGWLGDDPVLLASS